ncbi:MAG: ABC transporter ATP-binding protein [Candidatus Omnitrophica bacterium]|nr:ABC transporter ATP-binding protein [Candidatus Omnitrophota bacterium]
MNDEVLLEINNLHTYFFTSEGVGRAVDGVSLRINRGETLGLVGESGCGKSVASLSILRLVPTPPGRIVSGSIRFHDRDLLSLSEKEMRSIRGRRISMIFQEPMTALNPVFTVGEQIAEAFRIHKKMKRREAWEAAVNMMDKVRIPAPHRRSREFPHELSGGMRQRIMIAMALACDPDLLIADEPTTALDVTVQAQILALMKDLQERTGAAVLLITHDLGVIAEIADRVAVMYAGQIIEEAPVAQIFSDPLHPYTRGLLRAIPQTAASTQARLPVIPGVVPGAAHYPAGCRFHPRCSERFDPCDRDECPNIPIQDGRTVRCHLYQHSPAGKASL